MNILQMQTKLLMYKVMSKIWGNKFDEPEEEKQGKFYPETWIKEYKKIKRKIIFFNGNHWGNSFEIVEPKTVCAGDECRGHGFKTNRGDIVKGSLVCQTFNEQIAVFKITKIVYCHEPDDMFFWEGVRISHKDLTDDEKAFIQGRY